ncbi:uncharacterized protein LOC129749975 [Uranotaenia lowii]|uniref:uncharacterized protein LOC129749975 n=1 Tax=Uranotaenia lowii TaxID=190385 RepID=UPI00247A331A|nr:uncharacterized protein LOC129749975 [Uranotaenia lowii]
MKTNMALVFRIGCCARFLPVHWEAARTFGLIIGRTARTTFYTSISTSSFAISNMYLDHGPASGSNKNIFGTSTNIAEEANFRFILGKHRKCVQSLVMVSHLPKHLSDSLNSSAGNGCIGPIVAGGGTFSIPSSIIISKLTGQGR